MNFTDGNMFIEEVSNEALQRFIAEGARPSKIDCASVNESYLEATRRAINCKEGEKFYLDFLTPPKYDSILPFSFEADANINEQGVHQEIWNILHNTEELQGAEAITRTIRREPVGERTWFVPNPVISYSARTLSSYDQEHFDTYDKAVTYIYTHGGGRIEPLINDESSITIIPQTEKVMITVDLRMPKTKDDLNIIFGRR